MISNRVTFGPFGRLDGDGGKPANIFLDEVYVGEIMREVDSRSVGLMQKKYTVRAYVPSLQGPIGFAPRATYFEDQEFKSLPDLKRALIAFLGELSPQIAEAYSLYQQRKISMKEWRDMVLPLL